jgi:hypothetical protein
MGKKLMLAVALVALMAAPAFASVQNVNVGGDLKTTSVIRNNFTNAGLSVGQDSQNVILSQIGLNVQADLTDNVSTTLRLNNERIWGPETSTNTDIKLDAAYVTMKEMLYSPLTVVLGRQPLVYGNQFLIGDVNTYGAADVSTVSDLTGGVNADAIKAILTYDPLTVDLFAAKISTGTPSTTALNGDDDADLYGINANYKVGDSMNTVLEAYTFAKFDKEVATTTTKTKKLYVPGLRVSTNPIEGLNVQLEGAYQAGNDADNVTISAYGLQAGVNYALPVMKNMKPVLSAGYTYLSGDKNTGDNKDTSFDSLYENQNSGRIFDVVATSTSNIKIATIAAEVTPIQDVTTKLSVYNLNLVKKGTANARVGNEVDLDVTYAYTEDVKFGLSAGVFYPGKNFAEHQKELTQVLTSVNVMF